MQSLFKTAIQSSAQVPPGFDTGDYGAGIVNADALLRLKPDFAGAPEAAVTARAITDQVRDLLSEVAAPGRVEAIEPALGDRQSLPELACLAFDTARASQARAGKIEAMTPRLVSRGLQARLGGDPRNWTRTGAADAR